MSEEWEPILNWNDTCRFRFVDIRDYAYDSNKIQCIAADGSPGPRAIKKKTYLTGVIMAAEDACDENDLIAKHIAYSANYELNQMSSEAKDYEYGCVCPFASCISEPSKGISEDGTIRCGCVDHSSAGVDKDPGSSKRCLYPLTSGDSSFESEINSGFGRCQCDNGRHSYLDPISFQWSCICDEDNDDCIETGTYPPWTIPDNWTHPEIPTVTFPTVTYPTLLPTHQPPRDCERYAHLDPWNDECVCDDTTIHEMKDDGKCYCIGYNFHSAPWACYVTHATVALVCSFLFFLLFVLPCLIYFGVMSMDGYCDYFCDCCPRCGRRNKIDHSGTPASA